MTSFGKSIIAGVIVLVLVIIGLFLFLDKEQEVEVILEPAIIQEEPSVKQIGQSVEDRRIEKHSFGNGETEILLVGGIHGGYEYNSVLLAYEFIDYFDSNPQIIPDNLKITIIPVLNPDGLYKVVGKEGRFNSNDVISDENLLASARFNANNVDLNRNFDCKWQPESTWRGQVVSAGETVFSEPEAMALKNYVVSNSPVAVIFWHSKANAVYASECEEGILPETISIMNAYADAGNYRAVEIFDAYPITGDAEGWLASIGIPAITVELETRESAEWQRNLAGVKALINFYQKNINLIQ